MIWNDRARQPFHIDAKIMDATKEHICRNRSLLENLKQKFIRGFDQDFGQEGKQGLVLCHSLPSALVGSFFGGGD